MSYEVRGRASGQLAPTDPGRRLGDTAIVVAFVPPKRRGRPRKPPAVDQRCKEDFGTVAMALAGIARQKTLWGAGRERARRWADRDRRLRPVSIKVLGFLLEHVNRNAGFDWHSAATIAADLGVTTRAVENAFSELTMAGYLLREPVTTNGRAKATRPWRTTIPALVRAAQEVRGEHEAKARARLGQATIAPGPAQRMPVDPNKNAGGPEQERRNEPEHLFGQTLKGEPIDESVGSADNDLDQERMVGPAEGKKGRQEEAVEEASSSIERTARGSRPKARIEIPRLRLPPRFDQSLPMQVRLSVPGGRYAVPQTPDDKALRRRMDRAARGRDLHDLYERYVGWADSAKTPDAIEGFVSWMWRFVQTPAVGYVDLAAREPTVSGPDAS